MSEHKKLPGVRAGIRNNNKPIPYRKNTDVHPFAMLHGHKQGDRVERWSKGRRAIWVATKDGWDGLKKERLPAKPWPSKRRHAES